MEKIRRKLRVVIDGSHGRSSKIFDISIQCLVVISIISFSIETLPGLSEDTMNILRWIEIVTVSIFTAEYFLRIYAAQSARRYIFSFYGIIDLAAILPFYVVSGVDLRGLRALRLLRIFKIFHLFRRSRARLMRALMEVREEFMILLIVIIMLLYVASVGIYYFEHEAQPERFASIFHSLWWAVITLTTIGYGDAYPVTLGGKLFASLVALIGVGSIAAPAGLIAAALTSSAARKREESDGE